MCGCTCRSAEAPVVLRAEVGGFVECRERPGVCNLFCYVRSCGAWSTAADLYATMQRVRLARNEQTGRIWLVSPHSGHACV